MCIRDSSEYYPSSKINIMPKLKTHKGAAKRFSLSSNGKIMRSKGMKSHLRRKKSKRNKRLFGSKILLDEAVGKRIIKLLRR